MIVVQHSIKILLSKDNEITLSKDQAEELYRALANALNKTSSLYYSSNHSNNGMLLGTQGAI